MAGLTQEVEEEGLAQEVEEERPLLPVYSRGRAKDWMLCLLALVALAAVASALLWRSPAAARRAPAMERVLVEEPGEALPDVLNVTGLWKSPTAWFKNSNTHLISKDSTMPWYGRYVYSPSSVVTDYLFYKDGHWKFYGFATGAGGPASWDATTECSGVSCLLRPKKSLWHKEEHDGWCVEGSPCSADLWVTIAAMAPVPQRVELAGDAVEHGLGDGLRGLYNLSSSSLEWECPGGPGLSYSGPQGAYLQHVCRESGEPSWELSTVNPTKLFARVPGSSLPLGERTWIIAGKGQEKLRLTDPDAPDYLAFDGEWTWLNCYTADPVTFESELGVTNSEGTSSTTSSEHFSKSGTKWSYGGSLNLTAEGKMSLKPSWVPFKMGMPKLSASGGINAHGSRRGYESDKNVESFVATTKSEATKKKTEKREETYPKVPGQECFWQWRLPIKSTKNGEILYLNQDTIARTENRMVHPKCAPGCASDLAKTEGSQYQDCVTGCP